MKYKVKLSDVTTYKFGGYCNNFYKISKNDVSLFERAFSSKDHFILGKGSNIVFSDRGYKGNIISPNFSETTYNENVSEVKVGASVFLPDLSRFYKTNDLIDAEFLIGIPGSVGGAVKMNAGSYGWEFSDLLKNIEVYNLETKQFETLNRDDLNFGYRTSSNLENKVILEATLLATKGDPKIIRNKLKDNIKYRKKTQPPAIYNAGSVFKNTEHYSAGELIDRAGLKGYSIDGVKVSTKHANFFIASKNAHSSSLYKLVNHVKEIVDNKYGVSLEKEIIFVGSFDWTMNYGEVERQTFKTFLVFSALSLAGVLTFFNISSNLYRVSNIHYLQNIELNSSSLEKLKGTSIWLIDDTYFDQFYDDNPSVESVLITKKFPNTLTIDIEMSEKLAYIEDKRQSPPKTYILHKNMYSLETQGDHDVLFIKITNGPIVSGFHEELVTLVMTLKKYSLNMSNIEIVYDGQEMVVSHFNSKFYLGSASDLGRKAAVVGYYISESPCSGEIRLVYTETGDEIRAVTNCQ